MFGDLFDDAIKLGLSAIQTQHPGFYFQQAANHAIERKRLSLQLASVNVDISVITEVESLLQRKFSMFQTEEDAASETIKSLNDLDFFGQRPWRQGHQSFEPPDAAKEREGTKALQALEMKHRHSVRG